MFKVYDFIMRYYFGRNTRFTPPTVVVDQLMEPRPLPNGKKQWEEWSNRILSGVQLEVDRESLEYALATMILSLGPTESHKPDAHFIHSLRKSAANQVADARRKELYDKKKAQEDAVKAKQAADANPQAETTLERAKGLTLVQANKDTDRPSAS